MKREDLLTTLATQIQALPKSTTRRVAVDGVDGAGKTHLANELAAELATRGEHVIRASTDSFHNPRHIRHHQGRTSPEGFYQNSFDYHALKENLLAPLSPNGTGRYTTQTYDITTETPTTPAFHQAPESAILIFDGIFTHRKELVDFWDYSIWLEVPFTTSIPRAADRGGLNPDPTHESNHRYVAGQQLYIAECAPATKATVVVDNTDLTNPTITGYGR
jgi:uridine kinase